MKSYLLEIIPKIQKFGKRLDETALLCETPWQVLNFENQAKVVFIFRGNGELLVSTDGKVRKQGWEYISKKLHFT
jgi:hypothetical protein